ncbi:dTDP-4-dehydrorhamnose reductase [Thiomicrorhabdus cannonii]|uniref:dTDP-4-dehydrorhamnose reductase n=1 Tax=Thiomicrorhabdus cannonii TaxID=2748011 RepID=UPI0015B86A78|nr:dTDP-4-dehydrorhamnose reductase [Thiomicrorhabdus cannonii]
MLKVLVIGKNGQLGRSLQAVAPQFADLSLTFVGRDALDLSRPGSIEATLLRYDFDVVINCAAYTVVDRAESEVEQASDVNYRALKFIVRAVKQKHASLIQISTDYVFNGKAGQPYDENAKTDPLNHYGFTKLKAEQLVLKQMPQNAWVVRTGWLYSEYGSNFVKTMLRLGRAQGAVQVVCDQIGSPTYARDLACAVLQMIEKARFGEAERLSQIYHYSNEGVASWFDFAQAVFEQAGLAVAVKPIASTEYPTPAKRPHYSVLDKAKIKCDFDLQIPYWRDSLKMCLQALGEMTLGERV